MRTLLSVLLAGFVLVSCSDSGQGHLRLQGTVVDLALDADAIHAGTWPDGTRLARGSIEQDGRFSITVPGTLDDALLVGNFADLLTGATCMSLSVTPVDGRFAAMYFLGIDGAAPATLVAASSRQFVDGDFVVGDRGVLWFYADQPTQVEATCEVSGGGVTYHQEYSLALASGWNHVVVTITAASATDVSVRYEVGAFPGDVNWYVSN